MRRLLERLKTVLRSFQEHRCVMMAAGVSYFSLVSLAPMFVIVLGITTLFVDPATGESQLLAQVATIVGRQGANAISSMIESARVAERSLVMNIAGFAVLVFGATTLFAKLADALNVIFGTPQSVEQRMLIPTLRRRLLSLTLVVGIGFLLLVSLIVDTAIVSLFERVRVFLERRVAVALAILEFLFSTGLSAVLFATIIKVMPERSVPWREALAGGLVTSVLFAVTKIGFGIVLGNQSVATSYGAAGAVVVILLWVYVAALVLFLGAEFAALHLRERADAEEPES
ncbi:MAG: YihY/virulence factor BrkB family protein [Spirochaetota bacterium]